MWYKSRVDMAFVEIDSFGAAFVHVDYLGVVEAKETKDGGMDVMDVKFVFHCE